MTVVPIRLPPGIFANGTPYDAKNRWAMGNRVRWHDGSMRPIGGWEVKYGAAAIIDGDPATETLRDGFSWRQNDGEKVFAWGSNSDLYYITAGGVVSNITPAGFTGSANTPTTQSGYGTGPYGALTYGTPRLPVDSTLIPIWRWGFDTWGQDLIAGPNGFSGNLYAYSPSAAPPAVQIPNAPTGVTGFAVTAQRHVMTVGNPSEPRLVEWSDREDREDWTPSVTNQAGSFFLQGTGDPLFIGRVLNQMLILTETDAHVGRFIGSPFVFGFDKVGDNCGPIHPGGVIITDRAAFWLGRRSFFMFDGTLREFPCDVMDYLQNDIDLEQVSKLHSLNVPSFSELWWFYQSKDGSEVDSYISVDYREGHWQFGKLDRTAGVDGDSFDFPAMADPQGVIYNHEIQSIIAPNAYAETGPLEIGDGERNMAVRYLFPDTQTKGDVQFTLLGSQMPTEPEYTYGPYDYSNPVATRAMGRQIRMRVDGLTNNWEVGGATRFDVATAGTGMR